MWKDIDLKSREKWITLSESVGNGDGQARPAEEAVIQSAEKRNAKRRIAHQINHFIFYNRIIKCVNYKIWVQKHFENVGDQFWCGIACTDKR